MNAYAISASQYTTETFVGYFHPVHETPDGKLDGTEEESKSESSAQEGKKDTANKSAKSSNSHTAEEADESINENPLMFLDMSTSQQQIFRSGMLKAMARDEHEQTRQQKSKP